MTPERWRKAMEIFDAALLHGEHERQAFIDSSCDDDEDLGRAVRSLLTAHHDAVGFGSAPVMAIDTSGSSFDHGQMLGNYRIEQWLGRGGMGEVYRATDTNLKRLVAIKVLPAAVATD